MRNNLIKIVKDEGADSYARKLPEQVLSEAIARANEAERTRDELLAIAGHEMRTPLTAMMLHLQALESLASANPDRVFTSSEIVARVQMPITLLRRLSTMLDRLLDTSRIRTASAVLHLEPADIALLLKNAVTRFEGAAKVAGSKIELHAPEGVIAFVDSLGMEKALSNIVSNAIKFGRGAPISVELHTAGEYFYISVQDHGVGIAEANHLGIFKRYDRSHTLDDEKSHGLGLYIAQEIVKSHDGTISLESKLGVGSIFTLKLPLRKLR
ncbi:MAG: sensor histidine kinase [Bdellovibrionota bacterium]